MKPTQEQVIAWANEVKLCGCKWVNDDDDRDVESLCDFASLAYEAGRKDENDACARVCMQDASLMRGGTPPQIALMDAAAAIRARREQ